MEKILFFLCVVAWIGLMFKQEPKKTQNDNEDVLF
jgi:cbb3-type cytochrome oxidase subunit 3